MNIFAWINTSNRCKILLCAIPIGIIFNLCGAIGAVSGMEFTRKRHGNDWDWLDWFYGVVGGLIGQIIQIILLCIIFKK